MKRAVFVVVIITILLSIPLTIAVLKNQQDIRQRANDSGHLICQPQGGMDHKFSSDTLVVENQKSAPATIWVQNNACDYKGTQPSEGYQCNTFVNRTTYTINPGETKKFTYKANSCQIIQIDINSQDDSGGCYLPDGTTQWEGGLAYTVQANSDGYPDSCVKPTKTPTPTSSSHPTNTPTPTGSHTPTPTTVVPTPTTPACHVPDKVQNVKVTCPFCDQ